MFAGIHILHPRLLRAVPRGKESSIIEAYVRGIHEGERILGYDLTGYWSDVGTPERYAQVEQDAAAGMVDLAARKTLCGI
jgi:NDP-sugar pyrophosphorylase family protein